MKAVVIREAGQSMTPEDRPLPEPGPGQVRIRVHACGICHSDQFVIDAIWPDLALPRVPGHEVVGVVDAVGEGVRRIQNGDRVGAGWFGGNCGNCPACRSGDFILCDNGRITGISHDSRTASR
jgi:alcohol dehydrogenase/propanol-preferring alcohol dehydrogenase